MALKPERTPLEDYYLRKQDLLKSDIEKLNNIIDDLDVHIKEQDVLIQRLQSDLKYKNELIDRMTKYSDDKIATATQKSTLTFWDKLKLLFTFIKK